MAVIKVIKVIDVIQVIEVITMIKVINQGECVGEWVCKSVGLWVREWIDGSDQGDQSDSDCGDCNDKIYQSSWVYEWVSL